MEPSTHMNPAEYVIHILGGPRATARYVGRDHSSVIAWRKRGAVPGDCQVIILQKADKDGYDITAQDLILGRKVRGRKKSTVK